MQSIHPRAPSPAFALAAPDDGARQFPQPTHPYGGRAGRSPSPAAAPRAGPRVGTPPPRSSPPLFLRPAGSPGGAASGPPAGGGGAGTGGSPVVGGGMPPPPLVTPTKVRVSARGDDEVHPLAAARSGVANRQIRQPQKEDDDFVIGRGDEFLKQNSELSSLSSASLQNLRKGLSRGRSDGEATPSLEKPYLAKRRSSSSNASDAGSRSSRAGGAEGLTSTQQAAMDNFLAIQGSSNPLAREELWKELVRSMREDGGGGTGGRGKSPLPPTRGAGPGTSGGKGGTRRRDDILGVLKIGAADAVSIQSGLTSAEGWADAGTWRASPRSSPVEDKVAEGAKDEERKDDADQTDMFVLRDRKAEGERSLTPPNVPAVAGNDGLPAVSPLSLGDDWGADFDAHLHGNLDVTGKTTLASLEESTDGDNDEEGCQVFFDIGKGFADQNARNWQGRGDTPPVPSPAAEWEGPGATPQASLADLSDELSGGGESSRAPNEEGTAMEEKGGPRGLPPALPLATRTEQRPSPPQPPMELADDEGWDTFASEGLVAYANDGEVMSFQEMEAAAGAFSEGAFPTLPVQTREETPPMDGARRRGLDLSSPSPRRNPEPSAKDSAKDTSQRLTLDVSSSSRRRKKTRKRDVASPNLSLEETILSVLQQHPDSHIVEEEEEEEAAGEEEQFGRDSPFPAGKPPKKKSGKAKSGTVGSTASAQDILRELRSETPCTLQSGNSMGSAKNGRPLPRSISIGKEKEQKKEAAIASKPLPQPPTSEGNTGGRAPAAAPALAPSKRDLPRPHRLNRRGASEPKEALAGPGTEPASKVPTPPGSLRTSVSNSTASTMTTMARGNLSRSHIAPEAGLETGVGADAVEAESPLQRYRKLVGLDNEDPSRRSSALRGRLFPNTTPAVNANPSRTPAPQAQQPSNFHPTNPFDSPPRIVPSGQTEDPFEEQSSPILPAERSSDLNGSSSFDVDASTEPYSFEEGRGSPTLDEIRASISQLKHNGVGGVGKSTSTLVRNEATGRYVIRDVDDAGWKEMMKPKAMTTEGEALRSNDVTAEMSQSVDRSAPSHGVSVVSRTVFTLAGQLMEGSMLDDDAVDAAVQEAMECLSTTSSETKEEDEEAPPPTAPDDAEDLFVIRKPAQDSVKWTAFGSSTGHDGSWDQQWGGDDNDSFAPGPEWDCDGNEDSGFDAGFGGGDDWALEGKKPFGKKFYPSPTSVAVRRRLRVEEFDV